MSQVSAPQKLVIATRASRLALWQAEHVRDRLSELYPACEVTLLILTTRGDQILDRTLSKVGGKGLFVKELEEALLDGRADLAVHSLKDVPVDLDPRFALSTILERDDPRDALVSNNYASLDQLPEGAVVGTASLRREAQIRTRYPKLLVRPLRGNLDTRLAKLDRGEYDAIVLAAAGLRRLGLADRIRCHLTPEDSLPAAGQGALGIETLAERPDLWQWLQPLACADTTACAYAERTVSAALGGSCQVPLAAYAELRAYTPGESGSADAPVLHLRALVASPDGQTIIRAQGQGSAADPVALGDRIAQTLLRDGARDILAQLLPDQAAG